MRLLIELKPELIKGQIVNILKAFLVLAVAGTMATLIDESVHASFLAIPTKTIQMNKLVNV